MKWDAKTRTLSMTQIDLEHWLEWVIDFDGDYVMALDAELGLCCIDDEEASNPKRIVIELDGGILVDTEAHGD